MYTIQILIMVIVGLFVDVQYYDDYVSVQSNNKYTWVEYGGMRQMLKEKEIVNIYSNKITIGVN